MTKAAIYLRISSDREGERAGVKRQRVDSEALCRARGWEVATVYEDNDKSAYNGKERPEYQEMIAAMLDGDFQIVVAYASDRLWRRTLEQELFLALAREAGLKLIVAGSTEIDPNDADDTFISTILTAASQSESAKTAKRQRRKNQSKAENGEPHGGPRCYGYRTVARTTEAAPTLEIVPDEAVEIGKIAAALLRGATTLSIVRDLHQRNVPTTMGTCGWRPDTIRDLMRRPTIAGLRTHNGTISKGNWEPIISPEEHQQIVAVLDARRRDAKAGRRAARKNLLSGMLLCGKCGARLVGRDKHNQAAYQCQPKTLGGCNGCGINGARADEAATEMIIQRLQSEEFAFALKAAQEAEVASNAELGKLVLTVETDRAHLMRLGDDYADGLLDRAEYKRLVARVKERVEANERLLNKRTTTHLPSVDLTQLPTLWEGMALEVKREILAFAVDCFTLLPGRNSAQERMMPHWKL